MFKSNGSMNRCFRVVWNAATGAWQAVSESAKGHGKSLASRPAKRTTYGMVYGSVLNLALLPLPAAMASDLPTGGQVVDGQGVISQSGTTLTVTQSSQRLATDWQSFSIGQGHTVNFVQPNAQAVALNRVLGTDVSIIQGALNANGQVFLVNSNGILFTPTAQVDVGSLVASTLNISTADFMAGQYRFTGDSAAALQNQGQISAAAGGTVALLAARIINTGAIETDGGNILMGGGRQITLDLGGPVKLQIDEGALNAQIDQGGALRAEGGLVYLSVRAVDTLTRSVINHSGLIEASSITAQGGRIVLEADAITLASTSRTLAHGATGGGEALIGGDWQGSGPMHQATSVTMESGAMVDVSAAQNGDGGTAVLWSDIDNPESQTKAHGTILANSGHAGGNGGRIETSGYRLDVTGVSGSAAAQTADGRAGEWLFDPYNVTITSSTANNAVSGGVWTPSANDSTIDVASINSLLDGGTSVTVTTGNAGTQIGDITVASAITKSSGSNDVTLTLQAANSIVVDQKIEQTGGTGRLNVVLDADNNNGVRDGGGIIILNNDIATLGGNVAFGTGATMSIGGVTTQVGGDVYVAGAGARSITTGGGSVTVNGEMLIANTSGLNISTSNGNVVFGGLLNSANQYTFVNKTASAGTGTWDEARAEARSGTFGTAVGDSYLVNITSRLENAIAVRSTGYVGAWIGAYRPDQSTGAWQWADGPEAGQTFFNQNAGGGGTTVSGYYDNFASGEPNGSFTSSGTPETRGQFFGAEGLWNDLGNTTAYSNNTSNQYAVLGFVRETNLAGSPLTVSTGSGNVTFSGAVGNSKALSQLTVTSTGTIAINGGAVTTQGWQTYNGNVTLGSSSTTLTQTTADTDFTLQAGKSISNATGANASLLIKTTRDINLASASSISSSTGPLSVTLNSDSDATNGGAIWLQTDGGTAAGASISSNGGNITLSGGTDVATGYAQGRTSTVGNGITLDAATLNSAGGNILLRGKGTSGGPTSIASKDSASSTNTDGIRLHGSNILNAGAGTISLYGVAEGTGASNGIELNQTDTTTIQSSNSTANAILLDGSSSNVGASNGFGIYTWGASILATNGGGITLNGTGAKNAGVVVASGGSVLANSGKITLNGAGAGTGSNSDVVVAGTVGQKAATAITSSTSPFDVIADTISLSGTLQSSGALSFKPRSIGTTIGIAGGAGTLQLTAANFSNQIADGFSGITIGRSDGTGAITTGAFTVNDHLTLLTTTGGITIGGALNAVTNNLTLNSTGTVSQTAAITAGALSLLGTGGSHTLTNTANNVNSLTANTGGVTYADSNALSLGAITVTGKLDVATQTGDLTIAGNLSAGSTASDAMVLNGGKSATAGTATGGNLIHSSGTVSVGANGRATLYTGSVSGSTGLTSLVGTGTGHFRYNSDEGTSNYTTALGAGLYSVYREQPILSVTPGTATSVYGEAVNLTGVTTSVGGYANGDDAILTGLTGTASFTTGATSSSNVGSYNIAYASGLSNGLGYAIADNAGSTSEYTVTQRPITVTADAQSKTYGDADPSLTWQVTAGNLVGSDTLSGALTRSAGENVGSYTIDATALANGNYLITANNGTLTIQKANAIVTANSATVTYNGLVQSVTGFTASGLVNGETIAVLDGVITSGGSGTNAGSYAHTASGTDENYNLTFNNGVLVIARADASVTTTGLAPILQNVQQLPTADPVPTTSVVISTSVTPTASEPNLQTSSGLILVPLSEDVTPDASTGGASSLASDGTSPDGTNTTTAGLNPEGFMRVFVVQGGLNLPPEALVVDDDPLNPAGRRNPTTR